MTTLTLQKYHATYLAELANFCAAYLAEYPDAKLMSPEFYTYHPALAGGENTFCVFDDQQVMVGFAPLFPALPEEDVDSVPDIWTIILVRPGWETAVSTRHLLLKQVIARATELKTAWSVNQVRLAADMMVSQAEDIAFLQHEGFAPFEAMHVMRRDLTQPVPSVPVPTGITFHQSKLANDAEKTAYLAVYNRCFPEQPKSLADLDFLLASPLWQNGAEFGAFNAANELVGSILVYGDDETGHAIMDDVMVLPSWRGQKIAQGLVFAGLRYCQAIDVPAVRLEVRSSNDPAIAVYSGMGFQVINQEKLLGRLL